MSEDLKGGSMIGLACWFSLAGIPTRGVIVDDGTTFCNADTWIVKLDTPIACSCGCFHQHAAPPKSEITLES